MVSQTKWVWICILTVTIGTKKKIQGQFIIFSLFPLWIKRSSRINSKIERWLIAQFGKSKSKKLLWKGTWKVSKQRPLQWPGNKFSNKQFSVLTFHYSKNTITEKIKRIKNEWGTIECHENWKSNLRFLYCSVFVCFIKLTVFLFPMIRPGNAENRIF